MTANVSVSRARAEQANLLGRLWLIFQHEMSHITRRLPNPDGSYRSERLEAALTDPDWTAFVMYVDDHPVGFAIVRSLAAEPRILNSFFVVAPVRGQGHARTLFRRVVESYPGRWSVAYQDSNAAAGRFWPRVVTEVDPDRTSVLRTVPDRPDLPADRWIDFTVPTDMVHA